jgi:glycosyltransferase involved in cell wall biosynthesis
MLGDTETLERMGTAARKEAEKYSWERAAGEIENLYTKLLQ